MKFEPIDVGRSLEELKRSLAANSQVADEFVASRAEFFASGLFARTEADIALADRRHAEWFLLERASNVLGGVPIEWAVHSTTAGDSGLDEDALRALLDSRSGVFAVTGVTPGEGVWVQDLAAGGEYPLYEPGASRALQQGDLLVGRLFPGGGSVYTVSPAAGVFRSEKLVRALTKDVEQLRKSRRGVLRLSQVELERMFWGAPKTTPKPGEATERARTFLLESGVSADFVEDALSELRSTPFDPQQLLPGARDALGEILVRLAFSTPVDLEPARRLLLEAWPELSAAPSTRKPKPTRDTPRGDVRSAIEAFDRGRKAGRDLEGLFRDLERDLELESEEYDPDAIDGAPAPDFPGVVGAMVDEFLWEMAQEHGPEAARGLSALQVFAQFGQNIGVFENLGGRDLLLFAALWLPERGGLRSPEQARNVLEALKRFCEWSQSNHDLPLLDAYNAQLAPLEASLPRVVQANALRGDVPLDAPERGELFEIVDNAHARATLRDRKGAEYVAQLPQEIAPHLTPGDWVRASLRDEEADVYCCYPPQVAELAP